MRALGILATLALAGACGRLGFDALDPGLTTDAVPSPDAPASPACFAAIAAGREHSCVVGIDGSLACWGLGTTGQLGDGQSTSRSAPTPVPGLAGVLHAAAGRFESCAVLADKTVRCWGEGDSGQLGDGQSMTSPTPVVASGLGDVVRVASGAVHGCALHGDGAVSCWGANERLGTASGAGSPVPVRVDATLPAAIDLVAGGSHTCARTPAKELWCWGVDNSGQIGDGTAGAARLTPFQVPLADVVNASVRDLESCAVLGDGTAWCWGSGGSGELGNAGNTDSPVPVQVLGLADAVEIGVGISFACARTGDGRVWCWGTDGEGQLGQGAMTGGSNIPLPVSGIADATQLWVNAFGACALRATGETRCWGRNSAGHLGTGSLTPFEPAPVPSLLTCR